MALQSNASQFGIAEILSKGNGIEIFGDPTVNIRVPDIAIRVQPGALARTRARPHTACKSSFHWSVVIHAWQGGQGLLDTQARVYNKRLHAWLLPLQPARHHDPASVAAIVPRYAYHSVWPDGVDARGVALVAWIVMPHRHGMQASSTPVPRARSPNMADSTPVLALP